MFIEKPKESIQKLIELIIEFSNVAAYKVNIQNSAVFLHISNYSKVKLYLKIPYAIA